MFLILLNCVFKYVVRVVICWDKYVGDFYWISFRLCYKFSVPTFKPMILICRSSTFVYHQWLINSSSIVLYLKIPGKNILSMSSKPVLLAITRTNKTGFDLIIFYFNIHIKLSIIRCDKYFNKTFKKKLVNTFYKIYFSHPVNKIKYPSN